jgi:serine phosphatase RsbU (regulator of sigma subunit)
VVYAPKLLYISNMKRFVFIFFLLPTLFTQQLSGQNTKVDSLLNLIKKDKNDTNKVSHLNQLGVLLVHENPDTVIVLAKEALEIITPVSSTEFLSLHENFEEKGIASLRARALRLLAVGYYYKNNNLLALDNFKKSLQIYIILNDTRLITSLYDDIARVYLMIDNYPEALNYATMSLKMAEKTGRKEQTINSSQTIGNIYRAKSSYPQALEYYLKALKIAEELKDRKSEASLLRSIGNINRDNGNYSKALEYYFKSLNIAILLSNKRLTNACFDNISEAYTKLKDYPKAIEYNLKALQIAEQLDDKSDIAFCIGSLGLIYQEQKKFSKAEEFYSKSLKLFEEIGDKNSISTIESNLGGIYVLTGKFKEAEKYLLKSINTATEIGDLGGLMLREQNLAELYDTTGRYKEAYIHYQKAMEIKDTIFNQEKQRALVQKEMNYEFEKKEAITKAQHDKVIALSEEEKEKQKVVIYSIATGLLMVIAFAGYIFYSLRITRKQKIVIEQQKEKIIDSIDYAQSIQQSVLPEESEIKKHFQESFILYKPKDIVSGDFYWFSKVKEENKFIIAAVDCTGHGVPGAFMSMIGNMLLNQVVNENGITKPSEILELLGSGLKKVLNNRKDRTSVDGMDIALCTIDYTRKELQYAGAHNPLYIVHNNKIDIIKADNYEIGSKILKNKNQENKAYTNHCIPFKENMSIYLFSDGYADQFGENERKRFGKNKFQELLANNQQKSMEQQKELLTIAFEEWKGVSSQIDDILVIGIKL